MDSLFTSWFHDICSFKILKPPVESNFPQFLVGWSEVLGTEHETLHSKLTLLGTAASLPLLLVGWRRLWSSQSAHAVRTSGCRGTSGDSIRSLSTCSDRRCGLVIWLPAAGYAGVRLSRPDVGSLARPVRPGVDFHQCCESAAGGRSGCRQRR